MRHLRAVRDSSLQPVSFGRRWDSGKPRSAIRLATISPVGTVHYIIHSVCFAHAHRQRRRNGPGTAPRLFSTHATSGGHVLEGRFFDVQWANLFIDLEVLTMAVSDIGWTTIAANGSTAWFIHGFSASEAVTFTIVVFPGTGAGVLYPAGHATLTQGESFQHVDGTKAYKIYITNNAPFNSCNIHLLAQVESL